MESARGTVFDDDLQIVEPGRGGINFEEPVTAVGARGEGNGDSRDPMSFRPKFRNAFTSRFLHR